MCIRSDWKPLLETDMSDSSYSGFSLFVFSTLVNSKGGFPFCALHIDEFERWTPISVLYVDDSLEVDPP